MEKLHYPVGGQVPPGAVHVDQARLAPYGANLSDALRSYGEAHGLQYVVTLHFPGANYAIYVPAGQAVTVSTEG